MDFELTEDQSAIIEAAAKIVRHGGGPRRARALLEAGGYDHELERALVQAGFVDMLRDEHIGPLMAALVIELVARHGGLVAIGAAALVAPAVLGDRPPAPVALAIAGQRGPVRYGAHARSVLVLDGDEVRLRALSPGEARPVRSTFAFPVGYVPTDGGDRVGAGAAERLRAWWRVALAAEIAGAAQAALDLTVEHVKQREQFGRPIGTFQALQHRLAECTVLAQGSRWLMLEAAWRGAAPDAVENAATHAAVACRRIFREVQQLHGAMGLTREHDLHLWSMRLPALGIELG